MDEIENFFQCPYCCENISMMLDPSAQTQQYVEDCEVCCRPIKINFSINHGFLKSFDAYRTDD